MRNPKAGRAWERYAYKVLPTYTIVLMESIAIIASAQIRTSTAKARTKL